MIKKYLNIALILILLAPSLSFASTAENDERAKHLFRQIRCPVCEAQTIDGSDTDAARDMRNFVLKKIENGQSDENIINELRAAYGDSIVMIPPVNAQTTLLWLFPFLVLSCAFIIAMFVIFRKRSAS